jgi:hypothetical protein
VAFGVSGLGQSFRTDSLCIGVDKVTAAPSPRKASVSENIKNSAGLIPFRILNDEGDTPQRPLAESQNPPMMWTVCWAERRFPQSGPAESTPSSA